MASAVFDGHARKPKPTGMPINQHRVEQLRTVNGVGHGSQTAEYEVEVTIGLQDTQGSFHHELYRAPCVEGWSGPGLIGIHSLGRNDALTHAVPGKFGSLGRAALR